MGAQWEAGDGGPDEKWNEEETQDGWLPSPHLRCLGLGADSGNETEVISRWEVSASGEVLNRHVS